MLTFLLLIMFMLSFSNISQAQVGIKAGVSFSGLLSSNEGDFRPFLGHEVEWIQYGESKPLIGIHIGVLYAIDVNEYFDFQPEINFVQRGYFFDHTSLYDTRFYIKTNYLEFPVSIRYKLPLSESLRINFYTGPFVAIKLSANRYLEFDGKEDEKQLESVNAFDYGIIFGVDSGLDIGADRMLFDLRFNWGLSNIMSQPKNYIDLYKDPGTVKNLTFTFITGYRFESIRVR